MINNIIKAIAGTITETVSEAVSESINKTIINKEMNKKIGEQKMIPWDFGIIKAIKDQLGVSIFPSNPPQNFEKKPHLIFELNDITQGKNWNYKVGFKMKIVDNNEGTNLEILKKITRIIRKELTLKEHKTTLGSARIKIESVESKSDILTVNFVALLQLNTPYEEEDNDDDEYEEEEKEENEQNDLEKDC